MSIEISEHVSVTTTENSVGITRAGFGTQGILSCNATFPERSRTYSDLPGMVDDGLVSTSPEYRAAQKAFGQKPRPQFVKILRAQGAPTLKYRIDVSLVAAGNKYQVDAKGQGVTDTSVVYTPGADLTFTAANATEIFTAVAHGMTNGDGPYRVSNAGGALPAGLAVDTNYWINVLTADTYKLATTKALALAATPDVAISTDGTGTQTLRRAQNDVIIAQLVQGLNAVVGKNFTATQTAGAGETDYLEVTGNIAGAWFSVAVSSVKLLKIECTHAEPGTTVATDLDAIDQEDSDWYGLTTLYNSDAYVKAAAAWAEANGKIYIATMSDSTIVTAAATSGDGDSANDLKNLAYARTAVMYHPNPAAFAGAAWQGRVLPTEPGKATWKFKTLAGVENTVLTGTHRVNLRAKHANAYQKVGGVNITWEGTTCDADFIDVTRNMDWLDDDMQKGVFGALAANDIVPFTDDGIAVIRNEVEASLSRAVARGILAGGDDYPVVTVPRADDVAAVDRGNRNCPDIGWDGRLAGAIHKAAINGNVRV